MKIPYFLIVNFYLQKKKKDAQSKEPLQVARRTARGARVRNDRILQRRHKIIDLLKQNGMIYDDKDERKNPYELRAKAVREKVSLIEFGRIMYNLSLRRGFKSNRKELQKECGCKIKKAIEDLNKVLNGETLGQYLWKKFSENKEKEKVKIDGKKQKIAHTRFADNELDSKGNFKNKDAIYPSREMYEDEFERIWSKQAEFYDILKNEDLKNAFHNAIFYQQPLKPQQRGFCEFEDGEYRIYKAHPLFQRFRALQTINQMMIKSGDETIQLTPDEREKLIKEVFNNFKETRKDGKLSFAGIKKLLDLPKSVSFNLESEGKKERTDIDADKTACLLSRPECFGDKWFELDDNDKSSIVEMLIDDNLEDDALMRFLKEHYNLDDEHCENIINANLEQGTGSLSAKAIEKILPFLEEGQLYNDACKKAGYHHSYFDGDIEMLDKLPYYGYILQKSCVFRGKPGEEKDPTKYQITNISVHVALNQLRLVVNELIKKYGNPDCVAVEVARDLKMGTNELSKVNKQQEKNKKENERIIAEIQKEAEIQNPSIEDIQKYKMWEMLSNDDTKRCCVYSGKQISIHDLFSSQVQIEHILPYSRTFDDSIFNKTLSYREANAHKGNRTPYEAFGDSKDGYNWDGIMDRIKNLPKATQWRFNKNAMSKVKEYLEKFGLNDMIARQLNDTRYMSRLAVQYLKHICKAEYYTDENGKEHRENNCYGLPGSQTALFREQWGLNDWKDKENDEKYRASHIHHGIDAFVVACMTRSQLQTIARNATKDEEEAYKQYKEAKARGEEISKGKCLKEKRKSWFKDIEKPFEGFDRAKFNEICDKMPISFKPKLKNPEQENSTVGALHKDTAYSLLEFDKGLNGVFVKREELSQFDEKKKKQNEDENNEDDTGDTQEKTNENGKKKDNKKKKIDFIKSVIDTYAEKLINEYGETEEAFNKFKEYCETNGIKKIRCKSFADVSTYIPVFRTKQERDEYHKAYEEWFVFEGLSPENETKEQKEERLKKEQELLKNVREKASKAYKWFVGGNNFCADVYQINPKDKLYTKERCKWKVEVLSNYMATLNKGQALWKKKHPTARLVMRLKIDDMVMGEFSKDDEKLPTGIKDLVLHRCQKHKTDKVEILFRVKKMRSTGVVYIRPDFITKEEGDKKSVQLSASAYQKYKIRKVFVSPAGKLVDNGFSDKWNDTKCD